MGTHHPLVSARRHADRLATQIDADIGTSRAALATSIDEVARRAGLASSTVVRVLNGDSGVHLDTLCAVAAAVGLRIGVKAYPSAGPSLRDSGQLRVAEYLIALAHASLRSALELPVGDSYGRAADLVFFRTERDPSRRDRAPASGFPSTVAGCDAQAGRITGPPQATRPPGPRPRGHPSQSRIGGASRRTDQNRPAGLLRSGPSRPPRRHPTWPRRAPVDSSMALATRPGATDR